MCGYLKRFSLHSTGTTVFLIEEFPTTCLDYIHKDSIVRMSSRSMMKQSSLQRGVGGCCGHRNMTRPSRGFVRGHVVNSATNDGESSFFYDEHKDDAINRNVLEHWREFRALLVASEQDQLGHGATCDDLKKIFTMNHVSDSLSRHVQKSKGEGVLMSHSLHWSHPISHPERGSLLVAKMPDLGMFSYSVILMTEHDDEVGSSGLVLNMSTPLHVANLGLEEHINVSLGKCPLYIGGPVTRNLLHVLHGCPEVEGSMEIVPGVYAGGVESAADLVLQGQVNPSEFRLLAGYSGWEPYQLSEEIRQGAWHVISASSDVILGCIKGDYTGFGYQHIVSEDVDIDNSKLHCWKAILSETGLPGF